MTNQAQLTNETSVVGFASFDLRLLLSSLYTEDGLTDLDLDTDLRFGLF